MINLPVRSSVVISAGAAIVLAVSRTNKEQDIIRIIAGSMDLWQSNHINHMLRGLQYIYDSTRRGRFDIATTRI